VHASFKVFSCFSFLWKSFLFLKKYWGTWLGLAKILCTPVYKFFCPFKKKIGVRDWVCKKNWRAAIFNAKWGIFFGKIFVQKMNYFFSLLLLTLVIHFLLFPSPSNYWWLIFIPHFALFCKSRKIIKRQKFFRGQKTPYFLGVVGSTLGF